VVGRKRLLVHQHREPVHDTDREQRGAGHARGELHVEHVERDVRGEQWAQRGVREHQLVGPCRTAVGVREGQRRERLRCAPGLGDERQHRLRQRPDVQPGLCVVHRPLDGVGERRVLQQRARVGDARPEPRQQRMHGVVMRNMQPQQPQRRDPLHAPARTCSRVLTHPAGSAGLPFPGLRIGVRQQDRGRAGRRAAVGQWDGKGTQLVHRARHRVGQRFKGRI
jgi:hypothetical protein